MMELNIIICMKDTKSNFNTYQKPHSFAPYLSFLHNSHVGENI